MFVLATPAKERGRPTAKRRRSAERASDHREAASERAFRPKRSEQGRERSEGGLKQIRMEVCRSESANFVCALSADGRCRWVGGWEIILWRCVIFSGYDYGEGDGCVLVLCVEAMFFTCVVWW